MLKDSIRTADLRVILSSIGIVKNKLIYFLLGYYFLSVVISLLDSLVILLIAGIFTNSIDLPNELISRVGAPYRIQSIKSLYPIIFLTLFLQIVFKYFSSVINSKTENWLKRSLQAEVFIKIINAPWSKSSSIMVGEAVGVATTEIFGITKYVGALLAGSFSMISAFTIVIISLIISWKIVIMVGIVAVPVVLVFRVLNRLQSKASYNAASLRGELSGDITDRLNGLFQIKTDNRNTYHIGRGLQKQSEIYFEDSKIGVMQALISLSNPVLFLSIFTLIYAYETFILSSQDNSLSLFLGIAALGAKTVTQINSTLAAIGNISRLSGSVAPIAKYLSLEQQQEKIKIKNKIQKIELHDISIELAGKVVLSNLNILIRSGTIFLIKGRSGSGKTTLASIIAGVYDQYMGEIYFYDYHNSKYSGRVYSPSIAYITQDIYLYSGSIRENLLNGAANSDAEIWSALKKVGIDQMVNEIGGLDVSSRDLNRQISGGQKRRLGIARGLLTGASIFILDEITSGLDEISVSEISRAIENISSEKIIISISHENSFAKLKNTIEFELKNKILN